MSYHCPIDYNAYLSLPRWERIVMQCELSEWVERINESAESASSAPRQIRREGL